MSEQPPPPQVSPDGKFYWDGERWVPMQAHVQQPVPQAVVSPDGRSYWDGQRWVPMQGLVQPPLPPQAVMAVGPPPPFGHEIHTQRQLGRAVAIGCGGIIALFILIPFCNGLLGTSTSKSSSQSARSPAASPLAVNPSNSTTQVVSSPTVKASTAPTPLPAPPPAPTVRLDKTGSGSSKTAIFQTPGEWEIDYSFDCTNFGSQGNFQIYVYDGSSQLKDLPVNALATKGSDVVYEHNLSGPYYLEMNSECDWHVIVKG